MIFIGGTGRSGTTILSKVLSSHSNIAAIPIEMRFLTDPDGLVNLKYSLCDQWSFYQADFAVDRFVKLMKFVSKRYRYSYPNNNLGEIIGSEKYKEIVGGYISSLSDGHCHNAWAARADMFRKVVSRTVGINSFSKYIFDKSYNCRLITEGEFYGLTQIFLEKLEQGILSRSGKSLLVDHTPPNILHADFLSHLYAEFKIIHIYRDPRDVITSMSQKDWGHDDIVMNMNLIEDCHAVWAKKKQKLSKEQYLEIKFESLVHDTERQIRILCEFIGVPYEEQMLSIDLSHHNIGRWKAQLRGTQSDLINETYSDMLNFLGYL